MSKQTLEQIGQYLIWSENKTIEMLKNIPDKIFEETNEQFGRSIKDLANHIWLSYKGYFLGFESDEYNQLDKEANELSKPVLFERWVAATKEFADAIAKEKDIYEYPVDKEKKVEISMISNIVQYSDHSTYHRGQLITLIKQAGFEVVSTDYYLFLHEFLKSS
ncbi:MAG: DinB family protein [Candidatus Kariarchaeaceae archaeon]|jgi:uncharacterized damage-inducible protein DinB